MAPITQSHSSAHPSAQHPDHYTIYLAGGCFWGAEAFFKQLPGVIATKVGYANSKVDAPSYQLVCTGSTNAAETVKISYDPKRISLELLLEAYLSVVDPYSVNQQGNDRGTQYRTGIWWAADSDPHTALIAQAALAQLPAKANQPVAIEFGELGNFWPAEDYHQNYLDKNPGGYCHIDLGAAPRFIAAHQQELGLLTTLRFLSKRLIVRSAM